MPVSATKEEPDRLHAGVVTTVIALSLGHEQIQTTSIYLPADLTIKEKALPRTTPPAVTPGRFTPTDTLVAPLMPCDYADLVTIRQPSDQTRHPHRHRRSAYYVGRNMPVLRSTA